MPRQMNVMMYCCHSVKQNKKYTAKFEEREAGKWSGISTEKIPEPTLFQRLGLTSKPQSQPAAQMDMKGIFYIGSHRCPYCGNDGFVRCNGCGSLSCKPSCADTFHCGGCGVDGKITGKIEKLSGSSTETKDATRKTGPSRHL